MSRQSVEETFRSLNGFDEIAIENVFRKPIGDLDASKTARALVFTLKRRDGLADNDAFRGCMEMTLGDIDGYFSDSEQADTAPGLSLDGSGKALSGNEMNGGPTSFSAPGSPSPLSSSSA
jgi:hypothetical protein